MHLKTKVKSLQICNDFKIFNYSSDNVTSKSLYAENILDFET